MYLIIYNFNYSVVASANMSKYSFDELKNSLQKQNSSMYIFSSVTISSQIKFF